MKLKARLILSFIACGMLPLAAASAVALLTARSTMRDLETQATEALQAKAGDQLSALRDVKRRQIEKYFDARRGDMSALVDIVNTLRDEAFGMLTAVRETKRASIERYFTSVQNQILSFSEDRMIVDAVKQFRESFSTIRTENGFDSDDIERMRKELRTYYTGEFAAKYREENAERSPPVESFFGPLDDDSIALQHLYIRANRHPLGEKHRLDHPDDESGYSDIHARIHPIVRNFLERFGYYDIFLADPVTGDIVYSVFKELDYSTSLIDGPYADTTFGEAFRRANALDAPGVFVLEDYERYPPSYEAPASFIASPIFDGDEKVGIALFQMPIDRLNQIMGERSGLGETGETYVIGPDRLMRSDSYFDPENHSVLSSFKRPETGKVETAAGEAALAGQSDAQVIIDFNGKPVLSAYCPVELAGFRWGLLSEIDVAEAFCPRASGQERDFFTRYKEQRGYYDLFLINPDGFCFFTVERESAYRTNLLTGSYSDSNLGRLVREVLETREFGFADFEPYEPSNGDPAAFIAAPVVRDGHVEVVVVLQLSLDQINDFMTTESGLGRSGETYLVGPDRLRRCDSPKDGVATVVESFGAPEKHRVHSTSVEHGLDGRSGNEVVTATDGGRVLSSYAPIDVLGVRWVLLAEIDEGEAMAAVDAMAAASNRAATTAILLNSAVAVIAAIIVSILAALISRQIATPIERLATHARKVAEGDLTVECDVVAAGEVGDLVNSMTDMGRSLRQLIQDLARKSQSIASASKQLSVNSIRVSEQAQGTEEQAISISAAVQEMSAAVGEVAKSATYAANSTQQARGLSELSNVKILELMDAAKEIGGVIAAIQAVAEQTNLLSLNATIEAARVGELGKGFAVVASEVKGLANETGSSTATIRATIESIQESIRAAASSVEEINTVVDDVNNTSQSIAAAVAEQNATMDEIARNLTLTEKSARESVCAAQESQTAAGELAQLSQELETAVARFRL